jgi:ribosomal protein S18 acetylase RimI-like enzyme
MPLIPKLTKPLLCLVVLLHNQPSLEAFSLIAPCQETITPVSGGIRNDINNVHNMDGISIELARIPEDLPGIRECRSTVDFSTEMNLLQSQKSFLNATALTDPKLNTICVVARTSDGQIVGTTDCRVRRSEFLVIRNVLVRPDHRGMGIGEKMMLEGVEKLVLPIVSVNTLTLSVYTNNKAAVRLYEKCGYEPSDPANMAILGLSKLTGASLQVGMKKRVDLRIS